MAEPTGLSSRGTTVGFSATIPATTYTDLPGLKEIPDMGGKVDKIDVTTMVDTSKRYIQGLSDPGDLAFKFWFANGATTDAYRALKAQEGKLTAFEVAFPDGTKVDFDAFVQVSIDGTKVGEAIGFTANLTVNSEFTVTNPTT